MIGYIYMWENKKNHKKYIGETYQDPWVRWGAERNAAFNKKQNTYSLPLSRAIRKYGYQGFTRTVIDTIEADTEKQLKPKLWELEQFYIWLHRSFVDWGFGYNTTTGGRQPQFSMETKKKKVKSQTGQKRSEEAKKILSEQKKGEKNPSYGIPKTKEQKEYLSKVNKEMWQDPEIRAKRLAGREQAIEKSRKSVILLENGQVYNSRKEAEKFTGVSNSKISACINHKRKTAGGFHWCDADNPLTIEECDKLYYDLQAAQKMTP